MSFIAAMAGGPSERPPGRLPVRFCEADLFDLFDIDFRYGGPFTRADERASPPAPVVVLSDVLNQQLYGGADSVGRTIRLAGRDFRDRRRHAPAPGKLNLWDFGVAPENIANVLVPFVFADELRPVPVLSWPPVLPDLGWRDDRGLAERHRRILGSPARRRRAHAPRRRRCPGINPQLALRSADEIARRFSKAPAPYRVFVILTLVVLEVSVINLMRMLLAKATSRAAEIGIHRALGAGRNTIFGRQLAEGVIVSMAGSVARARARHPDGRDVRPADPGLARRAGGDADDRRHGAAGLPARRAGERHLSGLADRLGPAHALPREDMNPSLELGPILRSLRHHKGTFSLLVLEVALGFVMLLHTLLIARYYFHLHVRPNGMPEDELVVARRRFLHPRDAAAARAAVRADLAALGRTGAAAAAIDATPLPDAGAFPDRARAARRRARAARAGRCARRLVSQRRSACRSSPEPASTP